MMPKVVGPCLAEIPRFYYDKCEDKCKLFLYGGCEGNGNNFESMTECEKKCGGKKLLFFRVKQCYPIKKVL